MLRRRISDRLYNWSRTLNDAGVAAPYHSAREALLWGLADFLVFLTYCLDADCW